MPSYLFKHRKTGRKKEIFMSISELDPYLEANPQMEQMVNGAPTIGYNTAPKGMKPESTFRERLSHIHKNHKHSKINTW